MHISSFTVDSIKRNDFAEKKYDFWNYFILQTHREHSNNGGSCIQSVRLQMTIECYPIIKNASQCKCQSSASAR